MNTPETQPTAPAAGGRRFDAAPGSATDILDRMKSADGLTHAEAETFVSLLHKLDRIRLAEVSGYALGLAVSPRRTVIDPDHWALKRLPPNK